MEQRFWHGRVTLAKKPKRKRDEIGGGENLQDRAEGDKEGVGREREGWEAKETDQIEWRTVL